MKSTFASQNSLPKITIPNLNDTCIRFLEWVKPLLTQKEFDNTKMIVQEFKDNDGVKLQRKLIEWTEENSLSNWTAPLWKDEIYLGSRDPLVLDGNVFYLMRNKLNDLNLSQEYIAAALILSICKFKDLIDSEKFEVDLQDGRPICMLQYKRLFSSTRIPKKGKDEFETASNQKHIVVLHKGHVFVVNVLTEEGKVRSFSEIKDDLKYIIESSNNADSKGIGILTSLPRNDWADIRETLFKIDDKNKENIKKIENSIFVVCLDEENPTTMEEISSMMLHGNGKNRWFDKTLQFIVAQNGEIGINMEHTGVDGSVMAKFTEWIYNDMDKLVIDNIQTLQNKPKRLEFLLNKDLGEDIENAWDKFENIVSNTQTKTLNFDKFGKDLIKSFGVSPDAFVQLALQLAQYKLYGRCYSAYEAVMTRKFLAGRIEVMYSVTPESMKFIKNIMSDNCDNNKKVESLIKAAQKHIYRINECKNGRGVDGHLFGLLNMYKYYGKEIGIDSVPELFEDIGYRTLTHSTICTSTSSIKGIELAGYGPVVDDGFGIRYLKGQDYIRFNMTSRTYMKDKLDILLVNIEQSLMEMAEIMNPISHKPRPSIA